MIAFKTFKGIVAPLDRPNVDTDAIIPKEYLKSIKRTGFGPNLFDAWRYLDSNIEHDDDSRKINPDFILNKGPYNKAEILLARENFGCGSSREHAVWALSNFGFKVVLAPSFGDIFYSNSFKNGFLPIRLRIEEINILFSKILTSDNEVIFIPNNKFMNDALINTSLKQVKRTNLIIGIGYDDDIKKAKNLLLTIAKKDPRILTKPELEPIVLVKELADSKVNLLLRYWTKRQDKFTVNCETQETIKHQFDKQKISMPYPTQDVYIQNKQATS